jgi:hypothetical protein
MQHQIYFVTSRWNICNIHLKCKKHVVATCAHLLATAQWRLVDVELDAGAELDATEWREGHPRSMNLHSGRGRQMDHGRGGARHGRRSTARGAGAGRLVPSEKTNALRVSLSFSKTSIRRPHKQTTLSSSSHSLFDSAPHQTTFPHLGVISTNQKRQKNV